MTYAASAEGMLKNLILGNNLVAATRLLKTGKVDPRRDKDAAILCAALNPKSIDLKIDIKWAKKYLATRPWLLAFLAAYLARKNDAAGASACIQAYMHAMAAMITAIRSDLGEAVSSGKRIIVGPWCGEVGYEALYWIPLCRHILDSERLRQSSLVITRGGIGGYYWEGADERDYFALPGINAKSMMDERQAIFGTQKQFGLTGQETWLLKALGVDIASSALLHPKIMFNLFSPFYNPITSRLMPRRLLLDFLSPICLESSPEKKEKSDYVFVDLYRRPSFQPTAETIAAGGERMRMWGKLFDVDQFKAVRLAGLVDDHSPLAVADNLLVDYQAHPIVGNLKAKIELLRHAKCAVMTYGGMVYLANATGTPVLTFRTTDRGIMREHEELATLLYPHANKVHFTIS